MMMLRPLIFLVCLTPACLTGCVDNLVLHPPSSADAPPGAIERQIPFHAGHLQIWTRAPLIPGDAQIFVLEFGGNATRAEWVVDPAARRWSAFHAEVWAPNYPGFGGSSGKASLRSIPEASLAAYDAVRLVAGDRPIFLVGRSLGTTAALYVAAHRPTAGVLLHSATPLAKVIRDNFGRFDFGLITGLVARQVPTEIDSVISAAHSTAPALFVLTVKDRLVRAVEQQAVINAYAGPKQVLALPEGDHGSELNSEQAAYVQEVITKWIAAAKAAH